MTNMSAFEWHTSLVRTLPTPSNEPWRLSSRVAVAELQMAILEFRTAATELNASIADLQARFCPLPAAEPRQ